MSKKTEKYTDLFVGFVLTIEIEGAGVVCASILGVPFTIDSTGAIMALVVGAIFGAFCLSFGYDMVRDALAYIYNPKARLPYRK
jgi:hypothetical protein